MSAGVLLAAPVPLCAAALVGRWRSSARFVLDCACLAVLALALLSEGQGPLLRSAPPAATLVGAWSRVLAVAWWLFACRAAVSLARAASGHERRSRQSRLFSDLLAAGVYLAATLVVVDLVLGLPIGGLLATSGLVAIVLGLALQSTLADVFAGVAVGIEQPFRPGDRIRLGDGTEGRVVDMNWRSVRVQTEAGDLAVVPNSAIAKAEIVNRSSPSEGGLVRVEATADAAVPPERVLEALRAAAMLTPDALPEPAPSPALLRLGARTNGFAVTIAVADSGRAGAARSDLLLRFRRQLAGVGSTADVASDRGRTLLAQAALFATLAAADLRRLGDGLRPRSLEVGDVLFEQGTNEPVLYLMPDGVIELDRFADGRADRLGRVGAGDYLGEVSLLTGAPRHARATALTGVRLYTLDKAALDPLLANDADLVRAFERSLRRGRAISERNPAIATVEEVGGVGDLLGAIRRFFGLSDRVAEGVS